MQPNNRPKALKWPLSLFLFHFGTNTSGQRLVDTWLLLREWVLWPWRKGERSASIHPQHFSALLHCNLHKFLPAGNGHAANISAWHQWRRRGRWTLWFTTRHPDTSADLHTRPHTHTRTWLCCCVALLCVSCPLCFYLIWVGNLYLFKVVTDARVCVWVCVLRLKGREFKFCLLKMAAFQMKNAQQDNCFLSETNTKNASRISDYLSRSSAKKRKRKKSLMNANSTLLSWWSTFTNGADYLLRPVCLWEIRKDLKFWQVPETSLQPELQRKQMINECLLTALDAVEKAERIH